MSRPLIVYHSQSGASAALALAAQRAIALAELSARRLRAADAGSTELDDAAGLLLICAENSGCLVQSMNRIAQAVSPTLSKAVCTHEERSLCAQAIAASHGGASTVEVCALHTLIQTRR